MKQNNFVTFKNLNIEPQDYYLNVLKNRKLVKSVDDPNKSNPLDHHPYAVASTTEGMKLFKWKRAENIEFIKKSILIPIVVSLTTTLLVWAIGWIIKLLN